MNTDVGCLGTVNLEFTQPAKNQPLVSNYNLYALHKLTFMNIYPINSKIYKNIYCFLFIYKISKKKKFEHPLHFSVFALLEA
jgi:hypothetical protein